MLWDALSKDTNNNISVKPIDPQDGFDQIKSSLTYYLNWKEIPMPTDQEIKNDIAIAVELNKPRWRYKPVLLQVLSNYGIIDRDL